MAVNAEARAVMARINKKMGDNTVILGSSATSYPRITSGSLGLDVILGGGWAANQWHEIIGEESAGKTGLVYATIAANQAKDPNFTAVFIAAEQFVPEYAEMCGVDRERLLVVETNIMEEAYEATIQFTESQAVDAIVIDSGPALVPSQEDDKTMEENTVGRGALLTGKFFRKVGKASKREWDGSGRPVVGLFINQYREKIGVMHGDPRTTPLGKGKNFAFFTRVEVKRDEWIEVGTGNAKERVGQINRVKTIKNKSAPPQRTAQYSAYFAEGGPVSPGRIDYAAEIVNLGMLFGIFERSGAWYSLGQKDTEGYRRWQGKDAILDSVREEVDLFASLESEVLHLAKGVA